MVILKNVGLKEAAKREVGTGPGQIPDMSSFTSGPGWVRFGWMEQQYSRVAGFAIGVPVRHTPASIFLCKFQGRYGLE
jgi:hypothetical protein